MVSIIGTAFSLITFSLISEGIVTLFIGSIFTNKGITFIISKVKNGITNEIKMEIKR
jgi:hypothetical protein